MSMEARMTVCNMTIEAGARAGMIAPDETTFEYLKGRPMAPKGAVWEAAVAYWRTLPSDAGATYDKEVTLDASEIVPQVTWGTSPQDVVPVTGRTPDPAAERDPTKKAALERSLQYLRLESNPPNAAVRVVKAVTACCTKGRFQEYR